MRLLSECGFIWVRFVSLLIPRHIFFWAVCRPCRWLVHQCGYYFSSVWIRCVQQVLKFFATSLFEVEFSLNLAPLLLSMRIFWIFEMLPSIRAVVAVNLSLVCIIHYIKTVDIYFVVCCTHRVLEAVLQITSSFLYQRHQTAKCFALQVLLLLGSFWYYF